MIVGALEIQMMADLAQLRKDMSSANAEMGKTANAAEFVANSIKAAFAGVSAMVLVREFISMADAIQNMDARLKLATKTQEDFRAAQKSVYDISQRNLVPLDATAKVYSRLNPIVEKMGGTTETTAAITEALSAALRVSGASTQEASSVMIQFSQAMSSGVLRGEEFNSVSENGSRVLDALSNQLGKSRGELRDMAKDGKLTADVVGNALVKELAKLRAEAASMPLTVAGAWQRMQNDLAKYVDEVNKAYGITKLITDAMEFLRKNIDAVSGAIAAAVKVAAAYFAIYYGIPAVLGAVVAGFNALMLALAHLATGGVIASGAVNTLAGSIVMANSATLTFVGTVTKLQLLLGVLFAAFAGWEIGSWARKNFLEVELFGIAMVNGLLKAWEGLKYGFEYAVVGIEYAWEKTLDTLGDALGWFLDKFADGLEALGLDNAARKVAKWAAEVKGSTRDTTNLTDRLGDLKAEYDRNTRAIDAVTDSMVDEAVAAHGVTSAVTKTTGAVKLLTTTEQAAKKTKEELAAAEKARVAAVLAADSIYRQISEDALERDEKQRLETEKQIQTAREYLEQIESETAALKMTTAERAVAIAVRELERKGIVQGTLAYDNYIEKIREAVLKKADVEESLRLAKQQADELKKFNEDIGKGLTDSLFRAFEAGKGFWDTLWDGIKNTLKTTVLKVMIQPVQQGITGFVGDMMSGFGFGGGGGSAAGGGGFGSLMSMGSSIYNFLNGGMATGIGNAFAFGAESMGNWLVSNTSGMMNSFGGTLMQNSGAIGNFMGTAGSALGGFMAGRAAGQLISGGYAVGGGSGNSAVNIGAAIGAIAGPIGSIIGGAIGGLVNRAFGRKAKEVQEAGVTGTVVGGDFSGQQYADWFQKGGWFRSDKRGTDMTAMTDELSKAFDTSAAMVYSQVKNYATVLGLPAEHLASISHQMRIKLTDDEEANAAAINAAFEQYQAMLAGTFATALQPFQKAGETFVQTMARLTALDMFSMSVNELGGVFSQVANLSYDARESLLGVAGGMEALLANTQQFVNDYYTEQEKAALQAKSIVATLQNLGLGSVDLTERADFRALVESLGAKLEDATAQKQFAGLLELGPQFAELSDYLVDQNTTLEELAKQAPAVTALQTFNDKQAQYQETLNRNATASENTTVAVEEGLSGLNVAIEMGLSHLGGLINGTNNVLKNWDNGDSMNVVVTNAITVQP